MEIVSEVIPDFSLSHPSDRSIVEYTVVYLTDGVRVLMIDRKDKALMGKVLLGPGGAVECGETPLQGAGRELFEETGIEVTLDHFEPRGVFLAQYEDCIAPVYFYRALIPELRKIVLPECSEGTLGLYYIDEVPDHPLSPSSQAQYFLPVMQGDGTLYQGEGWYKEGKMYNYKDNIRTAEYRADFRHLRRLQS